MIYRRESHALGREVKRGMIEASHSGLSIGK